MAYNDIRTANTARGADGRRTMARQAWPRMSGANPPVRQVRVGPKINPDETGFWWNDQPWTYREDLERQERAHRLTGQNLAARGIDPLEDACWLRDARRIEQYRADMGLAPC